MSADDGPNIASTVEPALTSMPVSTAVKRKEGDIIADGYSSVQVGDTYYGQHNIFEMGTNEEKTRAHKARATLLQSLAYDGMDLKRSQLAAIRTTQASFEWINDTLYPAWLANSKAKPIWIQGKPASGKSMLMKHLVESRETHNRLAALIPSRSSEPAAHCAPAGAESTRTQSSEAVFSQQWQVLHFYFDYRIGVSLGNTVIGMMKHLLWQLCNDIPAVAQDLIENPGVLIDADMESYITILSRIMVRHKLFACTFIDGLDEYGGDLSDLCSHIEDLSSRSGMKLCLASRPDNPLTAALLGMGCEVILMQDHNLPAIRISVDYKLSRFEASNPHSAGWFPKSLRQTIAERAEGIFLWASLVVDLMTFHVKNRDNPGVDLEAFLSSFPSGLQELYDRILEKIKPHNQGDAALILHLLFEHELALPGKECSPVILFQAWNYICYFVNGGRRGPPEIPTDSYQARLKDILGNLLEFLPSGTAVRLLHKTLKEFLDHSQWIQQCLPETFQRGFSDRVWIGLAVRIFDRLGETPIEDGFKLSNYISKLMADAAIQSSHETRNKIEHDRSALRHVIRHIDVQYIEKLPDLKPWSSLIKFCLNSFYSFYDAADKPFRTSEPMLPYVHPNSAMIILHAADCPVCLPERARISWTIGRLHSGLSNEIFLMALANAHKRDCWSWGDLTQSMKHITSLGDRVMEDTFDIFVWSCLEKRRLSTNDRDVLLAFAKEGYLVCGRHVCVLGKDPNFERLIPLIEATGAFSYRHELKPMYADHTLHYRDCPDSDTSPSPAHHWLFESGKTGVFESKRQLRILINVGLDLDLCFKIEGGPLRAILQRLSVDKDVMNATTKFHALIQCPFRMHMDDIQYVEELQRQVSPPPPPPKTTWWKLTTSKKTTNNESYSQFLSDLTEVLRKYRDGRSWDQALISTTR